MNSNPVIININKNNSDSNYSSNDTKNGYSSDEESIENSNENNIKINEVEMTENIVNRETSIITEETGSEDIFEDDTSSDNSNISELSNKKEIIVNNECKCNNIIKKNDIDEEDEDDEDYICLICLDKVEFEDKNLLIISTECGCKRFYHYKCFFKWFNKNHNCPICRKQIDNYKILVYIYKNEIDKWDTIHLDKLFICFEKLKGYTLLNSLELENDPIIVNNSPNIVYKCNTAGLFVTLLFTIFFAYVLLFVGNR